ncbi:uncharacterized protein LOC134835437 [Culicoides brevitarsis]|uniref:uncharacterized protein LOC134835437 n=1 Tax=Culicoides brevitarsis TaxID=469753 RepID=UPI00307BFA32
MSTTTNPGLISCPYDVTHQLIPCRYQKHIIKCARQHPHIKLEVCPFNSTHHIKPELFAVHKIQCPDRLAFEKYMNDIEIGPWKRQKPKEIVIPEYKDDENWDDMVGKGGYDPKIVNACKPFARKIIGGSKNEKRQFYNFEKKRLQMIMDAEEGRITLTEEDLEFILHGNERKNLKNRKEIKNKPIERLENGNSEDETSQKDEIKQEIHENSEDFVIKTEFGSEPRQISIPVNPILIKQEPVHFDLSTLRPVKREIPEVDDIIAYQHKKQQEELTKIMRKLKTTDPLDPRLQEETRERSLSPIFSDLQSDPRLLVNPFSFIKGKEHFGDPRISSKIKLEKEKNRRKLEEETKIKEETELAEQKMIETAIKEAKIKTKQEKEILGDIDILDQLLDETEKIEKTSRPASRCSNASRESGELSDDDVENEDVIVIEDDSDDELDVLLSSRDFMDLKECVLLAKGQSGSDTDGSSGSKKRRSKSPLHEKVENLSKKVR